MFVNLPNRPYQIQVLFHHDSQRLTNCILKRALPNKEKILMGMGSAMVSSKRRFIEILERDDRGIIINQTVKVLQDRFCKKTGAKIALANAFKQTSLTKDERRLVWNKVLGFETAEKAFLKEVFANAS